MQDDPDPTIAGADLTPKARARRPGLVGTPVVLDGREWLLDAHTPFGAAVWDRLFDQNIIDRAYDEYDVRGAAFILLLRNYELTAAEAVALISTAGLRPLIAAVEKALFDWGRDHRTWGEYVEATLWSHNIDPERVPARCLLDVLDLLIRRGATPPHEWVSSSEAMAKRDRFLSFGKDGE